MVIPIIAWDLHETTCYAAPPCGAPTTSGLKPASIITRNLEHKIFRRSFFCIQICIFFVNMYIYIYIYMWIYNTCMCMCICICICICTSCTIYIYTRMFLFFDIAMFNDKTSKNNWLVKRVSANQQANTACCLLWNSIWTYMNHDQPLSWLGCAQFSEQMKTISAFFRNLIYLQFIFIFGEIQSLLPSSHLTQIHHL